VDNRCYTAGFMAFGVDNQLYAGRVYSHPASHCHYRRRRQLYYGAAKIEKQYSCPITGK
jgi:hypothetical protein